MIQAFANVEEMKIDFPPVRIKVRTKINYQGHIHLPVRINKHRAKGIFDSGAGISLVSESYAKRHGIVYLDSTETTAISASGASIPYLPAIIQKMEIGGLLVHNLKVGIVPDKYLEFCFIG